MGSHDGDGQSGILRLIPYAGVVVLGIGDAMVRGSERDNRYFCSRLLSLVKRISIQPLPNGLHTKDG